MPLGPLLIADAPVLTALTGPDSPLTSEERGALRGAVDALVSTNTAKTAFSSAFAILLASIWKARSNPGRGGRFFRTTWLSASGAARLQQFLRNLLEVLRFQTCELFIAEPGVPRASATPVMVAAAYRTAVRTYSISESWLSGMFIVFLGGEPIGVLRDRVRRYVARDPAASDDLADYVDYAASGTLVATLGGLAPSGRGPAASFWEFARHLTDLGLPAAFRARRGSRYPSEGVRRALRCLVMANRDLLIEPGVDPGPLRAQAEELTTRVLGDRTPIPSSAEWRDAVDAWVAVSDAVPKLGDSLRKEIDSLPGAALTLLLGAHFRAYPPWLSSATLRPVDENPGPTAHGNLRQLVAACRTLRNKRVHVPTLFGYESAARKLLLPDSEWNSGEATLRSMLVFPIEYVDERLGHVVGLLRFMNRWQCDAERVRLAEYSSAGAAGHWLVPPEEEGLFDALCRFWPAVFSGLLVAHGRAEAQDTIDGDQDQAAPPPQQWQDLLPPDAAIVASSRQMREVLAKAYKAASLTDSPILLIGESGTGKEVLAAYIHRNSRRPVGPYIVMNMSNQIAEYMEVELFGSSGRYRGVDSGGEPGKAEQAHQGTLFLDEIQSVAPSLAVRLHRLVEYGEVTRTGQARMRHVDVRFIASADRDLRVLVQEENFPKQLYFRLNKVVITIPPLRERKEDVPPLLEHFFSKLGTPRQLSEDAKEALVNHECQWPGNARNVENLALWLLHDSSGQMVDRDTILRGLGYLIEAKEL